MKTKTKTIITIGIAIVILFQFLPGDTPLDVEPIIPVAPSVVVPIPEPIVIFIPERYVPDHASGDMKTCGTCHIYPSFNNDNNPFMDTYISAKPSPVPTVISTPLPAPQKTNLYDLPNFIIPKNVPIPSDYYSQDCKLPTDQSMQEYLANSHWVDDYELDAWDCSQMAAYMEFMLENCGYNVVIRRADVEDAEYGHVWILVDFQEGMLAYECTGRYWVYPSEAVARSYDPYGYVYWNPGFYTAGVRYESIYDVWEDYKWYSNGEEVFLKEYGWWVE